VGAFDVKFVLAIGFEKVCVIELAVWPDTVRVRPFIYIIETSERITATNKSSTMEILLAICILDHDCVA
jgi:hypothetical protein